MRFPYALMTAGMALALVAACDTAAPYSNIIDTTGRGVGFSDYAQYMRAQEELSRIRRAEAAQARGLQQPPTNAPQYAQSQTQPQQQPGTIGQQAVAAVRGGQTPQTQGATQFPLGQQDQFARQQTAQAPLRQPPATMQPLSATAPQSQQMASSAPATTGASSVSNQQFTPQPFGTPQQNRLVERDFVPQVQVGAHELGQGGGVPNLFVYALATQHNVGETRFSRPNPLRWRRWEAACAQYPSQDLAQEAFLAAGGPDRDPNNLDPDGDGFACWWDPAPFRQAARTVRARE